MKQLAIAVAVIGLALIGFNVFAQEKNNHPPIEYRAIDISTHHERDLTVLLNKSANEGWRVTAVTTGYLYLHRER